MKRNTWIAAAAVGVVVLAAAAYVLIDIDGADEAHPPDAAIDTPRPAVPEAVPAPRRLEEAMPAEPPPEPPPIQPEPPVEAATEPDPIVLPPLAESDAFVREHLVGELVGTAGADWLDESDLVLRAAAVIANGRDGNIPTRLLRFARVPGAFEVEDADGVTVIAPATHARYDALVETATAIPPGQAAELIVLLEPLLVEGLAMLGRPEAPRALLTATLQHVLDTPVTRDPIAVEQPKVFYLFKNPTLESRSALQKQLLRMGPDNVRALKTYARELASELAAR